MKHQEEKASLCALGRIFGFEPKTAIALIEMSGSARNVFNLDREELDKILGPFSRQVNDYHGSGRKGFCRTGGTGRKGNQLLRLERRHISGTAEGMP